MLSHRSMTPPFTRLIEPLYLTLLHRYNALPD